MARGSKMSVAAPILIITVGIGWLLTAKSVMPGVDWVWVLGLAIMGLLILILGGLDKVTVVVGPFLIISTIFSLLRQTGRMSENVEVPCLVIVAGLLFLIARFLPVPAPRWMGPEGAEKPRTGNPADREPAGGRLKE